MLVLAAVLVLVALGVWLFCLFEVLSTDEGDAHHLPKFAWLLIVLFGFDLGAIAWLLFGRPRGFVTADVTAWPQEFLISRDISRDGAHDSDPSAQSAPPLGPDDDPEFLRRLDRRLRGDEP
jgi:membrane-associated phospholipid phosphatase